MDEKNYKILLVEDEPKLVRFIKEVLNATGYDVVSTGAGKQAVEMAALEQPDLILLDIVLAGDMDGYQVADRVREFSNVPIIILTAKARETDLLHGFDVGADDYITKPFSAKELLVRMRAVLNRAKEDPKGKDVTEISCGSLHIDITRREVSIDDTPVHLTKTEFNLLYELAIRRNQVVLHEELLSAVWGSEYRDDLEYLRAYIRYLRKKLEPDPEAPKYIVTSTGVGYMLECTEKNYQ
ncbi:response regulator transcription factor [Chloroflexota bacterium]